MAKYRRSNCRTCGISGNDSPISKQGLCPACGDAAYLQARNEVQARSGPTYDRYVYGLLNSLAPNGRPITPHPPDA